MLTEYQTQVEFIQWCRLQALADYPELGYIFAVPNGAVVSQRQRYKLVSEGLLSGVSDLVLPVARGGYFGMYLEMKREKGGRLSPHQKSFLEFVNLQGYYGIVANGLEDAIKKTMDYISLEPTKGERDGRC